MFVLNVRYLCVKQNCMLKKFHGLSAKLNHSSGKRNVRHCKLRWFQLRHEVIGLYSEITSYNHFWTRYLSQCYMAFIVIITYIAYMILFSSLEIGLFPRLILVCFNSAYIGILLGVTLECSRLCQNNRAILALQRRICLAFQQISVRKNLSKHDLIKVMIKIDHF